MIDYGRIYLITNTINNKVYVGQTVRSIERRWSAHKLCAKNGKGYFLGKAISKYGEEAFRITVLATAKDKEQLDALEIQWISCYYSFCDKFGYNLTLGGARGIPTEESRKTMGLAQRTKAPVSKETREKMAKAFKGLKRSEETCKRIRESKKNISKETREKLRIANLGRRNPTRMVFNKDEFLGYIKKGLTLEQMSQRFNCGTTVICKRCKEFYGETFGTIKRGSSISEEGLLSSIRSGLSIKGISKKFNCSIRSVHRHCQVYFGVSYKNVRKQNNGRI